MTMHPLNAALAAFFCFSGAAHAAETAPATDKRIAHMGRTVASTEGAVRFAYPGVSVFLRFEGKTLALDAASTGDKSWLDVIVDGAVRTIHVAPEGGRYVLVDEAQPAPHTVQVLHRSETWHGTVTLRGFTTDGRFAAAPALPARRLMFLGDSVTCGEALERTPPGPKQAVWWNPRVSYGMLAAEALGAQVHLVCHGGRGLVRSWNNRTDEFNLGRLYQLAIADPARPEPWDQRRYAPDLIVSAIGTNDFNPGIPERAGYVAKYVELVRTLLRDHPRARIVLTEGAILDGEKKAALRGYIDATIREVGDPRVSSVVSRHYPGDAADAHPTRAQHAAMAADLVPQLRAVMGW
ncbi:bifunctional acetylxylan esterase/glucomannan deacetylase AxeC2 [Pseudoduganella chitinolytica]|uniref:GDSL-type esterase/lipase family protein n=1 Tax=Pseudoduganella chitinolytica TaxID=34070 RepID=A0ABY8BD40_9BURK|nr:bifunctional acetylxylan esterase/glucomannan deacetylase AxeC2 [Pseudoduganella chitinolytica]WEF33626.1 GDSL-type esterase/lipase family protein [Pseudoduganella chitinolytica]